MEQGCVRTKNKVTSGYKNEIKQVFFDNIHNLGSQTRIEQENRRNL